MLLQLLSLYCCCWFPNYSLYQCSASCPWAGCGPESCHPAQGVLHKSRYLAGIQISGRRGAIAALVASRNTAINVDTAPPSPPPISSPVGSPMVWMTQPCILDHTGTWSHIMARSGAQGHTTAEARMQGCASMTDHTHGLIPQVSSAHGGTREGGTIYGLAPRHSSSPQGQRLSITGLQSGRII